MMVFYRLRWCSTFTFGRSDKGATAFLLTDGYSWLPFRYRNRVPVTFISGVFGVSLPVSAVFRSQQSEIEDLKAAVETISKAGKEERIDRRQSPLSKQASAMP